MSVISLNLGKYRPEKLLIPTFFPQFETQYLNSKVILHIIQNCFFNIKCIVKLNCDVLRDLVAFAQFEKREKHH